MNRLERIAKNPSLLFWARGLSELSMLNAIIALFYIERGLTIEQLFYLPIVYAIGTLILEIPSGYVADKIGRKPMLILGLTSFVSALAIYFVAQGFLVFSLALLCIAFGHACFSGTEQALLYDSLKELGREKEMIHHASRVSSSRHLFKIFGPAIGALIAQDLLEWQFDLVIGLNIIITSLAFYFLFRLKGAKANILTQKTESLSYISSLKTILREPFLFKAAMNSSLIFIGSYIAFRAYQPFLESLGISVILIGATYVVFHSGGFIGKWYLKKVVDKVSTVRLLNWTVIILLVSSIILALTSSPILAITFVIIYTTISNVREPAFTEAMHRRIESHHRATTLSNLNIVKAILDIPVFLLAGYVAGINLQYPFWIIVGLTAAVFVFFRIKAKEVEVK